MGLMETLEVRTLLTAWTTEDNFSPGGSNAESLVMGADANGNVFAAGRTFDTATNYNTGAILRCKPSGSSTWQTVASVNNAGFFEMAVTPSGVVYLSGSVNNVGTLWKGVWNGSTMTLSMVESGYSGNYDALAVDGAGNLFVASTFTSQVKRNTSVTDWVVRKQTGGQGPLNVVDDYRYQDTDSVPLGITVAPSGIYVVGDGGVLSSQGKHWIVRKSIDGGHTWATVDNYVLDTQNPSGSAARQVVADDLGVLHVEGGGTLRTQVGGTSKKPIYQTSSYVIVRSSSDGGANWTTEFPGDINNVQGMTTDRAGNVYICGADKLDQHALVFTNAGGSWTTSDSFMLEPGSEATSYYGMTRDLAGNVYAGGSAQSPSGGGSYHWIVRSMAAPGMAALTGFSTAPILTTSNDLLNDELFA